MTEHQFYHWAHASARPNVLRRDQEQSFDLDLWKSLAAEGFMGLLAPKKLNGLQATPREFAHAFRELAHGCMDIPFALSVGAHAGVATGLLLRFGTDEQIAKYLPGMMNGEIIAGVCNAENGAGTDLRTMKSSVRVGEGDWATANIAKSAANNLGAGQLAFVSAWKIQDGIEPSIEVFLLDCDLASQKKRLSLAGFWTGDVGQIAFEELKMSCSACQLGADNTGTTVLRYCFDLERLLIAVLLTGITDGILRLAMKLVWTQTSSKRALAEYQYIQDKVCSIFSARETLIALVDSAWKHSSTSASDAFPTETKTLSNLKMSAVELALTAATSLLEITGLRGYCSDQIPQKLVRDLLGLKTLGGTKELHKMTIFDALSRDYKKAEPE